MSEQIEPEQQKETILPTGRGGYLRFCLLLLLARLFLEGILPGLFLPGRFFVPIG